MKRTLFLFIALLWFAVTNPASACTSQTICPPQGQCMLCMTCCGTGGNCMTTCS